MLPRVKAPKSRQKTWPRKQFKLDGNPTVQALKYYGPGHNKYRVDEIPLMEEMNLRNPDQVKTFLFTQGWVPTDWNFKKDEYGRKVRSSPKLTEESYASIRGDIGKTIADLRKVWSREGVLQGWLEALEGRVIHPLVGGKTVTHRLRHSVVANVPRADPGTYFGTEMRQCFVARPGRILVGCDSESCQMRMLCHELLAKGFPAEDFAQSLLKGDKKLGTDAHSVNRDGINGIIGQPLLDRTLSKTVFYAAVFGASTPKMAKTIGCDVPTAEKVMEALYALVPGLGGIKDVLKSEIKQKGYVEAIDGRPLYIRSPHMALVSLMQGNEAAAMEMSMVWADNKIRALGLEADQLIYYHDELDYEASIADAKKCGAVLEESIAWPGEYLGLKVPLVGESQYGPTWAEVH